MRTINSYSLGLLGAISTFAVLSIIFILNSQNVFSESQEISYVDVNDSSSVSKFTVAAWFKTSDSYKSDAFIVNKAGASGHMNYGIWMNDAEKIRAGFETSSGKPVYATSPLSYNDGKWHYALVTFDGSAVNLYMDGILVATQPTSDRPDNGGNEPVRVGADAGQPGNYFVGNVDEVRVWNTALNDQQISDTNKGKFDTNNQVLYLDFSEPIATVNATSPTNQTGTNATEILAANQTGTNATEILAANQTGTNATVQNALPLAFDQSISLDKNSAVDISLNASDDDNDHLTYKITADPSHGTLDNFNKEKGTVTYTPQKDYSGDDKFSFTASDNKAGESQPAIVDLEIKTSSQLNETNQLNETAENIKPILKESQTSNETGATNETLIENQTSASKLTEGNNLPKAFDQSISVDQNNQADITLVADDKDKDQLQFAITADPSHGTLDNFNKEKGTVTYTPQKGYSGDDKFSFRATDIKGGNSEPATVDIKINTVSQFTNETETKNTKLPNTEEGLGNQTNTQTNTVQQTNQPPKADAGDSQYATVGDQVKLDGSKSTDEDGKIVSYKWEQTDGPNVDLKNADQKTANFDVPLKAADSTLSFKLTVTDDKGASNSDGVTVQIGTAVSSQQTETNKQTDTNNNQSDTGKQTDTIQQSTTTEEQVKPNIPPKADAGDDQKAEVNDQVKLDGSKSTDEDGKIVSYKWEQTDGPNVDLKNADQKTANFDVPLKAADSTLSFKLTVTDDKGASNSDDVTVNVQKIQNIPPKADAGDDQKAEVNDQVKLDGSKSTDEDGKIVSYKWEQTDGPNVDLKNADEKTANFDVPLKAADSTLSFKLTVDDDKNDSNSDDTKVQVDKISQTDSDTNSKSKTNNG